MKFTESKLAHQYLDGLDGIEIGGSAHNAFGLKTRNVDYTDDMTTVFKKAEIELCGEAMPVDIVAPGDRLPLDDCSVDFVISSHVLEHIYDPIGALLEWTRVIKVGGFIFTIFPKPGADPGDVGKPHTKISELLLRHVWPRPSEPDDHRHWTIMDHLDGLHLVHAMMSAGVPWRLRELLETDDKVGNGWAFVVEKTA